MVDHSYDFFHFLGTKIYRGKGAKQLALEQEAGGQRQAQEKAEAEGQLSQISQSQVHNRTIGHVGVTGQMGGGGGVVGGYPSLGGDAADRMDRMDMSSRTERAERAERTDGSGLGSSFAPLPISPVTSASHVSVPLSVSVTVSASVPTVSTDTIATLTDAVGAGASTGFEEYKGPDRARSSPPLGSQGSHSDDRHNADIGTSAAGGGARDGTASSAAGGVAGRVNGVGGMGASGMIPSSSMSSVPLTATLAVVSAEYEREKDLGRLGEGASVGDGVVGGVESEGNVALLSSPTSERAKRKYEDILCKDGSIDIVGDRGDIAVFKKIDNNLVNNSEIISNVV